MSDRFATGLVVGKFAPFHHGHQHLIRTALERCERVVVISYTKPEFDRCGPAQRERWISTLHPAVDVLAIDDERLRQLCRARGIACRELPHNAAPAADHRQFVGWLCDGVLDTGVEAVFTSEDYGDGFAEALSAYFGERQRPSAPVRHISVDRDRGVVPVSGTRIRHDSHAHRQFVDPRVYRDLIARVALLGGESSGKTALAQALAAHFDTGWVAEVGRVVWEQRQGQLRLGDMLAIGHAQVAREAALVHDARRWLFCDTTPLTTAFYSRDLFDHVDPALEQLASRGYHHTLLCAPDFAFVQDGTRRDASFRERQHHWYLAELRARKIDFTVLRGPVAERLATAVRTLGATGLSPPQ